MNLLQAFAAMILYALISRHWKLKNFWAQVFAFALLLAMIRERFLFMFLMEIIADNRNISYEFMLSAVPAYLTFLFVAGIIVKLFSLQKKSKWHYFSFPNRDDSSINVA